MRKLLFLFIFIEVLGASTVKADVPANTFCLGNNSCYNQSEVQIYYCFQDGNCYDTNGTFAFTKPSLPSVVSPIPVLPPSTVPTPTPAPQPTPTPSPAPTPTPSPVPSLLPVYTDNQLLQIVGGAYPFTTNIGNNSIIFQRVGEYGRFSNLQIQFNGQSVLTQQGAFHQDLSGWRDWAEVGGLSSTTPYTYQIVYTEAGRQDTIINKTFTTK